MQKEELFSRIGRWVKWFFTPPRTLSINRSGRYFIGSTFAVGMAAVNTGNNLLYIVLGALLSFIVVSGILSNIVLKKIRVTRETPRYPYAKRPVFYRISVTNMKRFFPSYLLGIEEKALEGAVGYIPIVTPGETASGIAKAVFPRRGRYELGRLKVSTNFPFGLFVKGMHVPLADEVVVLPRVREIDISDFVLSGHEGETIRAQSGQGTEPFGVTDFLPGENPRHIHWKSSAKRDEMMRKEFADEKERRVTVELVVERGISDDRLEKKVETAASLVTRFMREGYAVGLALPSRFIPPAQGDGHLHDLLLALALFEVGEGTGTPPRHKDALGTVVTI
jgi:uncharacterized protein (DUF58 family)